MLTILAPVLVFGLVIFVHELGHFLAAKATGVYAPRFSIGFGPALWRKRWGETEYMLGALPLGGYVRMASRLDQDMAAIEGGPEEAKEEGAKDYDPEAMAPFGPKPIPEDRLFESKPLPARLLIMIAGVTMNFILAFVVLVVLMFVTGRLVIDTRVVGKVDTTAVPALAAIQRGDTIQAINGVPVRTWNDIEQGIAASHDTATLVTQRGSVKVPISSPDAAATTVRALSFFTPIVFDSIVAGSPAAAGGLQRGDSVLAIDGVPVHEWTELVEHIAPAAGRPVTITVARGGATTSVVVTPRPQEEQDPATGKVDTVGKIGAGPKVVPTHREGMGPVAAVQAGGLATIGMAGNIFGFLKQLFTGTLSVRQLGGPIAITKASVQAARTGAAELFFLIAFLSINVAILNLLPIPILDGGQIVINVVESAKGKPLSLRTREALLRVGLAAIGLLFVVVMYNDSRSAIARAVSWIGRLFG